MKKSLLLLGLLLMSGSNIVKAEQATIAVECYSWDFWPDMWGPTNYSYDVDINCVDGVYTIDNFLKSGSPLSFTLDRGISADSHTFIKFTGNVSETYNEYNILNTTILKPGTEEPIVGKICTSAKDMTEIEIETPAVSDATDLTYAYLTDNVNGNCGIVMFVSGITGYYQGLTDPTPSPLYSDYLLKFYINIPKPDATPITIELWNNSGNALSDNLPYETTLNVDKESGIYTVTNFLNSTQPMSFSFNPNDENVNIPIELIGNVKTVDVDGIVYNYLTDPEGRPDTDSEYLSRAQYLGADKNIAITKPYINLSRSYVTRVDKEQNNGNNYMANIYVANNTSTLDRNLRFYFSGPEKGETGITEITGDNENAPVEYYNLNGQRVSNPANGIFVRKQGSKVEKIVIR